MSRWLPIALLIPLIAWQSSDGQALRDAARTGDLATVQRLLDAGVDVDDPDRYASTALSFAARAGHLEVVRLLLERGADPDIFDTFYGMSAVSRALQEGHLEIAALLLEAGATDGGSAIAAAIQDNDLRLAQLGVAAAPMSSQARDQLLQMAERAEREDIAALLRAATIDDSSAGGPPPLPLPAYVGTYRNDEAGTLVQVREADGRLLVIVADAPERALESAGGRSFRGVDDAGLALGFFGRGTSVEFAQLQDGDLRLGLRPLEAEEAALLLGTRPAMSVAASGTDARPATPHWPAFRGPDGAGISDGHDVPVDWDIETGRNVAWKTAVPGIANSSPVVWGDRVFVTTAVGSSGDDTVRTGLYGDVEPVEDLSSHEFMVVALDRRDGKVVWERTVFSGPPQVKRHPKSSQANSTPVTDGQHLVVLFGSVGQLACFDFDGQLLWQQDIGVLDSGWFYDPDFQWGHAASPVIYDNLVIVQADVQRDPFLAAYDLSSGQQVWRTNREEIPTFSTPAIYRGRPRHELITNGTTIRSYDPRTGEELWRLGPNSEVIVSTPIVAEDMVYVTAGYPPVRPIYAVRPGGSGDISLPEGGDSNESVLWSKDRGGVYIPTPLLYRGVLYTANNDGRLTAYDAATGAMVLRARVGGTGGSFVASPVAADGYLYLGSEDGSFFVLRAGLEYDEIARNEMNEVVWATPAITPGLLVVRTLGHVYGIGAAR